MWIAPTASRCWKTTFLTLLFNDIAYIMDSGRRIPPRIGGQGGAGLLARHGERLRLRTFAVVSLGFDRLVWQELQETLMVKIRCAL